MKADPINGVWFILAHLGDGPRLPEGKEQDYYLVWTGALNLTSHPSWFLALLFHEPVRTLPNGLLARNIADQRARACLAWWRLNTLNGTDPADWPDPPHPFSFFDSDKPGSSFFFAPGSLQNGIPEDTPIRKATHYIAAMLRSVWPKWKEWGEAEGIPGIPTEKMGKFHEDENIQ